MNEQNNSVSLLRSSKTPSISIRTPRIMAQNSKGNGLTMSQNQTKVIPLISSTSEATTVNILKTLSQKFFEALTKFITHNCSLISFRNVVSNQTADVERLFGVFYGQVFKNYANIPSHQQGIKQGARNIVQSSSLPFLKLWKKFAYTLFEFQETGPADIQQNIENLFEILSSSLDSLSKSASISKVSVHNTASRNLLFLIQQKDQLHNDVISIFSKPKDNEEVKTLASRLKNYSRLLNDGFNREFTNCGIASSEVVRLRSRTYSACSEIIHSLRAAYLFDVDISSVFSCFFEFQDSLAQILDVFGIPTTYLFPKSPEYFKKEVNELIERDFEDQIVVKEPPIFASCLTLSDMASVGLDNVEMFQKDPKLFSEFLEMMKRKSKLFEKQVSETNKEIEDKEKIVEETRLIHNRETHELKRLNQQLYEEKERISSIMVDQERELNALRDKYSDNEFKQCLRQVARQLGGILQEEEVNFENDDDDDQLISKVNALTVYVVERKCQSCAKFHSMEEKVKEILSDIAVFEKDKNLLEISKEVKKLHQNALQSLNSANSINISLNNEIVLMKNGFKSIQSLIRIQSEEKEFVPYTIKMLDNYIMEMNEKYEKMLIEKEHELLETFAKCFDPFNSLFVWDASDLKPHKQEYIKRAKIIYDTASQWNSSMISYEKAMSESIRRISSFIGIKEPGKSLNQSLTELIYELETRPNPLSVQLIEKQQELSLVLSNLSIIVNRLKGITHSGEMPQVDPKASNYLIKNAFELLDEYQDRIEKQKKQLELFTAESGHIRSLLETIDLKLHKYIKLDDVDLKKFSNKELMLRINQFTDQITKNHASTQYVGLSDIDVLFSDVLDIVPVTTRADPFHYIPEICSALVSLHNSVMSLKSFASILNDIFVHFDCKFSSFKPGSQSFSFIRSQMLKLHNELNALSPNKVNSLVFLVLSRFVALFSSFLAAISSMSYDSSDPKAQEFLFSLQAEKENK